MGPWSSDFSFAGLLPVGRAAARGSTYPGATSSITDIITNSNNGSGVNPLTNDSASAEPGSHAHPNPQAHPDGNANSSPHAEANAHTHSNHYAHRLGKPCPDYAHGGCRG